MPSRRDLLRGSAGITLGALTVPLLQACGGGRSASGGGQQATAAGSTPPSGTASPNADTAPPTPGTKPASGKIQFAWWGGQERAKYTTQIVKAYQQSHPNTTVQTSFTDWGSYWQKIATQAAGKNIPDVLQMDVSRIGQFAAAGQLFDFNPYRSALQLNDTDKGQLGDGTVGGKLVAITTGANMDAFIYNASLVEKAGMPVPDGGFTRDEFSTYAKELQKKLPKNVWVMLGYPGNFFQEVYLRQYTDEPYTMDGKIAFTKEIVQEWMQYWFDLQEAGCLVPPDKAPNAASGNVNDTPLAIGVGAFSADYTSLLPTYVPLMKGVSLKLSRVPTGGKHAGDQVAPSMYWSAAANTKNVDLTISLISYLLHDPTAIKLTGLDRGVPANPQARALLSSTLDNAGQQEIAFINKFGPLSRPQKAGYVAPSYNAQMLDILTNVTTGLQLKKWSPAKAADMFMSQMETAEKKAGL